MMSNGRLNNWLRSGHGVWQRHAAKVVRAVAFAGVPMAVVFGSGGLETIAFWVMAFVWIPLSFLAAIPVGRTLLFFSFPVLFILDKLFSGVDFAVERVM